MGSNLIGSVIPSTSGGVSAKFDETLHDLFGFFWGQYISHDLVPESNLNSMYFDNDFISANYFGDYFAVMVNQLTYPTNGYLEVKINKAL